MSLPRRNVLLARKRKSWHLKPVGFIVEPKGVDFIVVNEPLTKKEREEAIAVIENDRKRWLAKKKKMAQKKKVMA